ncbi:MAG TPA: FecR domain-containing protein [Draconibacterium sp.]|nr:FecR domain-containing protein [Draconibacterium sp.]
MSEKNIHSNNLNRDEEILFRKGKVAWEKSQYEVWAELEKKISTKPKAVVVSFRRRVLQWSVAAVLLLIVGLLGVVSNYSETVISLPGEHKLALLPDGSSVEMNAESKLTYYPLKWCFERKLRFEGEAYFNVKKGKKFLVISEYGTTQVLGTSFNIYSRDNQYRVTCLTGKVQVDTGKDDEVTLLPNNHAELENGKLVVKAMFKPENAIGWKNNQFFFEGRPLKEVIDEIERQYAVTIKLDPQLNNRNFGSNFSKKHSVEEVLEYVCRPMNLKFVKQSENVYLVVEKS